MVEILGGGAGLRIALTPDEPIELSTLVLVEGSGVYLSEGGLEYATVGGSAGLVIERSIATHLGLRVGLTLIRAGYLRQESDDFSQGFALITADPTLQLRAHF